MSCPRGNSMGLRWCASQRSSIHRAQACRWLLTAAALGHSTSATSSERRTQAWHAAAPAEAVCAAACGPLRSAGQVALPLTQAHWLPGDLLQVKHALSGPSATLCDFGCAHHHTLCAGKRLRSRRAAAAASGLGQGIARCDLSRVPSGCVGRHLGARRGVGACRRGVRAMLPHQAPLSIITHAARSTACSSPPIGPLPRACRGPARGSAAPEQSPRAVRLPSSRWGATPHRAQGRGRRAASG